jgi:hypothetical protein
MSHEISIEFQGEYIHARHTGADSYDISLELWQRIMAACREHDCFNILGESDNTNELSTLEAFAHIAIYRKVGMSARHRIAWVNHNPRHHRIFDFIETVLKNRFVVNGHIFESVAEAERWLLSRVDTPTPLR